MSNTYDISAMSPFLNAQPEGELGKALLFIANMLHVYSFAQQFGAALALADYTDILDHQVTEAASDTSERNAAMLQSWREMAARDAAMSVYHFGKTIETLKNSKSRPPMLPVDAVALRTAGRRFAANFPGFIELRNGVGHRAEVLSSLKKFTQHAVDGNLVYGNLTGRRYTMTNEGQHRTLDITKHTHATLVEIGDQVFAAFPTLRPNLPPFAIARQ